MTNYVEGQMTMQDLGISFGKTCQAHSQATPVTTSGASSKKSPKLSKKMPIYLDLRRGGGHIQDASWETGIPLPISSQTRSSTELRRDEEGLLWLQTSTDTQHRPFCLTLNIGEKPREPNPTKLSEILQDDANPKYNLSARACQGILNRANKRGKELPEILRSALEAQSNE